MLQVVISHCGGLSRIEKVVNKDTLEILATFDSDLGCINLEPLIPHIGEEILVSHYDDVSNGYELSENEKFKFSYEHRKILTNVDRYSNGVMYLQYR